MTIKIWHGIYDIVKETAYDRAGFYHDETQTYIPMSNKLEEYLYTKSEKMYMKYDFRYLEFIFGRDTVKSIEVLAIVHPVYDKFDDKVGEDIVVGRIKRMRGDLKKVVYEMEVHYKLKMTKDKNGIIIKTDSIKKKRPKKDAFGKPIVKKEIFFKPYDLDKRYRVKKNGKIIAGDLMYPYIYGGTKYE